MELNLGDTVSVFVFAKSVGSVYCVEWIAREADGRNVKGNVVGFNRTGGGRYWNWEYHKIAVSRTVLEPQLVGDEYGYGLSSDDGYCEVARVCATGEMYKPIQCRLFPLVLNANGTLFLSRWVNLQCPNVDRGPFVFEALEPNLRDVFGDEWFEKLEIACHSQIRE